MTNKVESGDVAHAEVEITQLGRETSAADVAEITTKNPYTEINFIGTYVAILMGVIASYGGYVMPVTSLAFINDDLGQLKPIDGETETDNLQGPPSTSPGYRLFGRYFLRSGMSQNPGLMEGSAMSMM